MWQFFTGYKKKNNITKKNKNYEGNDSEGKILPNILIRKILGS